MPRALGAGAVASHARSVAWKYSSFSGARLRQRRTASASQDPALPESTRTIDSSFTSVPSGEGILSTHDTKPDRRLYHLPGCAPAEGVAEGGQGQAHVVRDRLG